ncbi:MAG: hypothetical protein PHE53_12035, partial [Thermoguttaceae bacterium]|nr:hypothetical protein [Thermoguttaceae bacterium]
TLTVSNGSTSYSDQVLVTNSLFMMDHQTTNFNPTYRSYTQSQQNLMWSCDLNTGVFETANTGGLQYPTAFTAAFPGETQNLAVTDNGGPYLKSVNKYENGFEMTFDYAFDRTRGDQYGYVQVDTNNSGAGDSSDTRKVSFVANSGIKLGGIGGASAGIPEVAIIDTYSMVMKAFSFLEVSVGENGPTDDQLANLLSLNGQIGGTVNGNGTFNNEPLNTLLNGVRYGGDYVNMTNFNNSYVALLRAAINRDEGGSGHMKIVWNPNQDEEDQSLRNLLTVYINDTQVYTQGGVSMGDGYIYVQTHWGSGVTISNVDITSNLQ